jgi:hypothetical protein
VLKNFLNVPMHTARIPPVDPAPAAITAALAMHAGHIFPSSELLSRRASVWPRRFRSLPHKFVQVCPAILRVSVLLQHQTKGLLPKCNDRYAARFLQPTKGEAHSRAGVCAGRLHAVELCEHTAENLRYLIFLRILTKRMCEI